MYHVIQKFCPSTVSNNTYILLGISLIPKTNVSYVYFGRVLYPKLCNCLWIYGMLNKMNEMNECYTVEHHASSRNKSVLGICKCTRVKNFLQHSYILQLATLLVGQDATPMLYFSPTTVVKM
jgi:hypothetical protein